MVDTATHFPAASFQKSQSTAELCRTIRRIWSLVYLIPPDWLTVDQGTYYLSWEMRQEFHATDVRLKEAPIESHVTIGTVERYYAPLRSCYENLRMEAGLDATTSEFLQLSVFPINFTAGPEGLCPIVLVFGAIPDLHRTPPLIHNFNEQN